MAKYTMSIMDILLENSNGRDLQDVDVMTDVAKKALFGKELNYISEEHRDHFAAGFAYHFFFDEIGSVLKIKELQREKRELLESLELFYKVFFLQEQ